MIIMYYLFYTQTNLHELNSIKSDKKLGLALCGEQIKENVQRSLKREPNKIK